MQELKGQLTLRGIIIGCVGCAIITAASVYMALRMGMLPWPIIFAAIISLFFLKALGRTNLNEANVTHTVMTAGAMTGGGLAFTIPGLWMLGHADEVSWWQMLIIALAGVVLGLLCTVLLRRHFVEKAQLEFPIGQAAAQTLIAGNVGGKTGAKLFGALGFSGIYTFLRDGLGMIPAMLFGNVGIPGVVFGIYNSPMLLAVGFLVGTTSIVIWFVGALLGNFGIIVGGSAAGLWDVSTGQGITASLGMGVMMGCGVAVIVKLIAQQVMARGRGKRLTNPRGTLAPSPSAPHASTSSSAGVNHSVTDCVGAPAQGPVGPFSLGTVHRTVPQDARTPPKEGNCPSSASTVPAPSDSNRSRSRSMAALVTVVLAAVALVLCFVLGLGPLPSIAVVTLVWVTTAMSSQSVGQTGIDPMEIFGLIVLLIVAAIADVTMVQLFFVAAIIAVACGLAGDVMNDFKAGHVLGTNPRAQWIGQAIGGLVGAVVAVIVMVILVRAYGPGAFGPQGSFVATQASVVATMLTGIPSMPAFAVGLAVGFGLYLLKLPSMMLGLGIYLPFYLSFSAFLGAMAKVVYDLVCRLRASRSDEDVVARKKAQEESGLVVASGLLGGESIVSILVALMAIIMGTT
jgi:uncharacterized oligopeptide transporter (OPT) family protein